MSNSLLTLKPIEQGVIASMNLGLNKIALMVEKAAWCDPIFDFFSKKYADKIVYSTRFSTAATDFSVEFSQAKTAGANVLVVLSTGRGGIPSVKQWYDMKILAMYVGYPEARKIQIFGKRPRGNARALSLRISAGFSASPLRRRVFLFITPIKKCMANTRWPIQTRSPTTSSWLGLRESRPLEQLNLMPL